MTWVVFAGGGPLNGKGLPDLECPPPPEWVTPALRAVETLDGGLVLTPTGSVTYQRVRWMPGVAAVYWLTDAGDPTPDDIREALDRALGQA